MFNMTNMVVEKPPGVFLTGYSSSVSSTLVYQSLLYLKLTMVEQYKEDLLPVAKLVEAAIAGTIDPVQDKVFPFDEIVKAHEYHESGAVSIIYHAVKEHCLSR